MLGAQRIGGLWRIYPKTTDARVALLSKGLILRGYTIQPREQNPFLIRDSNGEGREVPSTKLIIGNVPLSFNNMDILKTVEKIGIKTRSNLMDERDRDENGKLTRWLTGRRFLFIDVPTQPLPKTTKIGIFTASLYHKEQKIPTCSQCLAVNSHHASACTAPVKCRTCLQDGHKAGDAVCSLAPPPPSSPMEQTRETTETEERKKAQATKQSVLSFVKGQRNTADTRRSRSATPGHQKRQRSPSQISPRNRKNQRNVTEEDVPRSSEVRAEATTHQLDSGEENTVQT